MTSWPRPTKYDVWESAEGEEGKRRSRRNQAAESNHGAHDVLCRWRKSNDRTSPASSFPGAASVATVAVQVG